LLDSTATATPTGDPQATVPADKTTAASKQDGTRTNPNAATRSTNGATDAGGTTPPDPQASADPANAPGVTADPAAGAAPALPIAAGQAQDVQAGDAATSDRQPDKDKTDDTAATPAPIDLAPAPQTAPTVIVAADVTAAAPQTPSPVPAKPGEEASHVVGIAAVSAPTATAAATALPQTNGQPDEIAPNTTAPRTVAQTKTGATPPATGNASNAGANATEAPDDTGDASETAASGASANPPKNGVQPHNPASNDNAASQNVGRKETDPRLQPADSNADTAAPTTNAADHRAPDVTPSQHTAQNAPAAPTTSAVASQPAAMPTPSVTINGVAIEIATQARAGKNQFDIRLDPPELGRIDVRLSVDREGRVSSHLVVDRAQTLDLLRRDAPQLERALQDAGLKTSGNGLEFSLRDQGSSARQDSNPNTRSDTARVVIPDQDAAPVGIARPDYSRARGLGRGVDIQV
jgi:chemotaxis protein MotD